MDTFAFGLPEVTHWAHFSGDFNPIHFDGDSARQAGLDDVVVHGMLALLTVKREVSCASPACQDASRPWLRFHALLRSPVPHGAASRLSVQPGRRGALDFRVSADQQDVERFRGSFGPCAHPFEGTSWPSAALEEARDFADEDLSRFASSYPDIREGWIALDALVFSDFMRHRLDEVASAAQAHLVAMAASPADCFFVQTSHTIAFDPTALGHPGPLPLPCGELRCAMGRPEVLASSGQVVGTVALPVFHRERPVMQVELGLLARPRIPFH